MTSTSFVAYMIEAMEELETPFFAFPVTQSEKSILIHKDKVRDILIVNPELPVEDEG